ncbi:hypothetical protein [Paenibacillus xerothermodurans]|uniref:Uncharacterized protein n=1 Tax=Paenibacillus xerothermodurans TaxID=1977292 RepID=A0A2W1NSJ4_PAEXE|nr:hypothetical protein [Paenibacillus xerothermodurans]PZE21753.1 hypothetical protein CBW46_004885 [Paenibacillus xerothermodurans]
MVNNPWVRLAQAESEQELVELQNDVRAGGYSAFHLLLEGCKRSLKEMQDDEVEQLQRQLATARRLFPDPGAFSPSWLHIWTELEQMLAIKSRIMRTISKENRDGEWQVILDNPYTIHEVVCHPGLSFGEAAYLYSYFRPGLEKNEYLRLQKIQTMVTDVGS